jgi:membrane protein required for colicin V production
MNYLDIVILCFLGLLVFNGVRKGFIISLATLVALILGIWAAIHFSNYISVILEKNLHPSGTWLPILSFSVTFLLVLIIIMLIAKGLEKLVSLVGMGFLDHLAGGIFGLLKGLVFVSVLFFIISSFDPKQKLITPRAKEKSFLYGYVEKIFPGMMSLFGGEIKISESTSREKGPEK